jgi:hypothetical protein
MERFTGSCTWYNIINRTIQEHTCAVSFLKKFKQAFKIPKKQRVEERKKHERELNVHHAKEDNYNNYDRFSDSFDRYRDKFRGLLFSTIQNIRRSRNSLNEVLCVIDHAVNLCQGAFHK